MQGDVLWGDSDAIERAHLEVPSLRLESTIGPLEVKDFCADRAVLYFYPATGVPERDPSIDPAPGWDNIPGAAGCTPHNLGFRGELSTFQSAGIRVAGVSTQPLAEQCDFARRHELSHPLLCDEELALQGAWRLPTFVVGGRTFLKRMVLYVEANHVQLVVYPIMTNPGSSARSILERLTERGKIRHHP